MDIDENGIGHGLCSGCVSMALLPIQRVTATDIRFDLAAPHQRPKHKIHVPALPVQRRPRDVTTDTAIGG
jgi:hypothetical protein